MSFEIYLTDWTCWVFFIFNVVEVMFDKKETITLYSTNDIYDIKHANTVAKNMMSCFLSKTKSLKKVK